MSEVSTAYGNAPQAAEKLTRSERQYGKPAAPVALQRSSILAVLAVLAMGDRRPLSMSVMAYAAFPDYKFRSPQGAALAVCRTVRGLYDDKLLAGASHGYRITEAGLAVVAQEQLQQARD